MPEIRWDQINQCCKDQPKEQLELFREIDYQPKTMKFESSVFTEMNNMVRFIRVTTS